MHGDHELAVLGPNIWGPWPLSSLTCHQLAEAQPLHAGSASTGGPVATALQRHYCDPQ